MVQNIGELRAQALGRHKLTDFVASLSAVSAGAWEVEQMVDPSGEVSIVMFPACDDPALPTFMLFEENGLARVATIRHDVWESDQTYLSNHQAVAAIMAATAALSLAA
jgi:hypothetical protein